MAFSNHDVMPDSPINNFCTFNPLYNSSISLSDGNLTTGTFLASAGSVSSSMQMLPNAITYFEIYYETSYLSLLNIGLLEGTNTSNSWGIRGDGEPWNNAPQTAVSISFTTEDVLGVIVDIQNSKWYLAKNGALQLSANISNGTGYIHNNLTSNLSLRCWNASNSGSQKIRVNFGQDPTFGGASNLPTGAGDYDTDASGNSTGGRFAFQPPTGALALCTANLPDFTPTVTDDTPQDYFKAVLYTGNGTSQSITGVGFQPDFVFLKERSAASGGQIYDSCRGAQKILYPNATNSEETYSTVLTSFDSGGFTLGEDGGCNELNQTYVAWCWKAGGAPTADNSNTSGAMTANSVSLNGTLQSNYTPAGSPTIYPTRMSINTDAGFSIVKYTGTGNPATVPHGLSSAPDLRIIKGLDSNTDETQNWFVWSAHSGSNAEGRLDLANAFDLSATTMNGDSPVNSNTFPIGSNARNNQSAKNYIAYCWHSVEGYSKFGSYTGNGSVDGTFVYTGFRPAWIMIKRTTVESWIIVDNVRNQYNPVTNYLLANSNVQESPGVTYDFLSNGIKFRAASQNEPSSTYIYMAFAKQPFSGPSNAR